MDIYCHRCPRGPRSGDRFAPVEGDLRSSTAGSALRCASSRERWYGVHLDQLETSSGATHTELRVLHIESLYGIVSYCSVDAHGFRLRRLCRMYGSYITQIVLPVSKLRLLIRHPIFDVHHISRYGTFVL